MSMLPCPGCGMPRAADQVMLPCPVCAAGPAAPVAAAPVEKKPSGPDPTKGLPSDVGELNRAGATDGGFPKWFGRAAVLLFGVALGVCGILGWQATHQRPTFADDTANAPRNDQRPLPPVPPPPNRKIETAPLPHEPKPIPEPDPDPVLPEPKGMVVHADRTVIVELNQPAGTYTIPFSMKKGEKVVLKGKIGKLHAHMLDGGSVLDASGLEAGQVYVGGKIDNGCTLKLNAPGGKVTFAAAVLGKSNVEINAAGGEVIFSVGTTPVRQGSAIDGGSTVAITARIADLRGDINGSTTKVTVNIPRTGTLKIAAIRGTAVVEYRLPEGKGLPDVSAVFVSPAASLRKVE